MVKKCENDSLQINTRLLNGNTYLHIVIKGENKTPILNFLINHPKIDINIENLQSQTALFHAIQYENLERIHTKISTISSSP